MDEQEKTTSVTADDGPGGAIHGGASTGHRLSSGINALGWSAGIAVLTAFATFAGMVREAGKFRALALYSLSRPAVDQADTYVGMLSILAAVVPSLAAFSIMYLVYRFAAWAVRKSAVAAGVRWERANRLLPWVALIIVLLDVGLLNASLFKLSNEAEGIILKTSADAGVVWTDILLDNDFGAASAYMLLFGVGMAVFVAASWWLIDKKLEKRPSRIAFSSWATAQLLALVLGFSYHPGG